VSILVSGTDETNGKISRATQFFPIGLDPLVLSNDHERVKMCKHIYIHNLDNVHFLPLRPSTACVFIGATFTFRLLAPMPYAAQPVPNKKF
jgi:hypothetical protein